MDELLERLLPPGRGNADTIQGELIRHAYYLYDDGYRRGFAHWDTSAGPALDFLRTYLPDSRVFEAERIIAINEALDRIAAGGPTAGFDLPVADLRLVLYRAVDWCDHFPQPRPLPADY